MSLEVHLPPLLALGLAPDRAQSLNAYLDLLAAWSERTNLTGARTPGERVEILVRPVLAGLPHIRPGRLLDVGSGNGSPGLVLALIEPALSVTLLEPRQRRWAFLREAARVTGRPDLDIRRERLDQYGGPAADTLTLRALTLEAEVVSARLVLGGRALVWGRPLAGVARGLSASTTSDLHVYERVSRETGGATGE